MNIGENIRNLRKKAGLTQKKLAEEVGINEVTIRSYEAGKYNPKIETLEKIADALGVPEYELRGFDGSIRVNPNPEIERLDAEARKILEKYESFGTLTKEEQNILIKYKKELRNLERKLKHLKGIEDKSEKERKTTITKLNELQIGIPDFLKRNDGKYIIIDSNNPDEELLLSDFRELNTEGQSEARKRVSELTEIPRYTKPLEPPQE